MKHKHNAGFTIVEIIVVVIVISIIASITLVSFNQIQKDSRDKDRVADVTAIKAALSTYYRDNNQYPAPCAAGVSCNATTLSTYLAPKYIPSVPKDPKGIEYNYVYDSTYNADAYGIFVQFEGTPGSCKTGISMNSTWWSSAATCPANTV